MGVVLGLPMNKTFIMMLRLLTSKNSIKYLMRLTCYENVKLVRYLTQKLGISASEIVVFGRSLGTAAAVHLASTREVAGVILQSGISSIYRIIFNLRRTLPGDIFASINKVTLIYTIY